MKNHCSHLPSRIIRFTVLVGLSLALSVFVSAQVPNTMSFQGYLTSAAGARVTGKLSMTFRLYTLATGGTASWTETQTVSVINGVYNVILGSVTPLSIDIPQQYYLGVSVGGDAEMTPRARLASVMSALTLRHVTLSSENTFVGRAAGNSNTTGNNNTFVGSQAGNSNTTGGGNIFIGYGAGGRGNETVSNRLYIANSSTINPLIYGEFDTRLLRVYGELDVTLSASKPGGGSWSSSSDQRLKDVQGPFRRGLEALAALQPVAYRYSAGNPLHLPSDTTYIGLLAQEVKQTVPEAVSEGQEGYLTLNNDPLLWTMLNAIKQLNAKNEALQAEVDVLRQEFVALKAQLNQ
jgi:hypothetical protein